MCRIAGNNLQIGLKLYTGLEVGYNGKVNITIWKSFHIIPV